VTLVLTSTVALATARGPLRRATVERFADRQRLELTDDNAAHVVRALLVTHRWRRAGLVVGLAVGLLRSALQGSLSLHLIAGLLGWFVGAVIAEWRIGQLVQPGERRAAEPSPRVAARYLTGEVRLIVALVAAVLITLLLVAGVLGGAESSWWWWLSYVLALGTGLFMTVRTVVGRPSGFVGTDVRAADEALRCHGLTVLAGAAIAASYPALVGLALTVAHPAGVPASADPPWGLGIVVLCLVTGYLVAVWSPSTRSELSSDPATRRPPGSSAGAPARAGGADGGPS
jgi:hypothetical protein